MYLYYIYIYIYIYNPPEQQKDQGFVQWVADNVDHNIVTLTGKGTFHGMGIISVNSSGFTFNDSVPRLKERRKTSSSICHKGIDVFQFIGSSQNGLSKIKFDSILQLKSPSIIPSAICYNLIWHTGWFFRSPENPRPNWNGFMQKATCSNNLKKASISFLPIIDLNPSDENCIYSTLMFIIQQSKSMNIPVPCVTFDQPLWLKAVGIIEDANLGIVCRLGGFHTMMSFLGSIGNLMKGSGIEELFGEVYAGNSVIHMMSGKAISRALPAHLLVESALTTPDQYPC